MCGITPTAPPGDGQDQDLGAEVEGSTKKLYAQKHTGNARRGNIRTNVMKGGGNAFGKLPRDFRQDMPLKQRRLARNNAILSKILSNNLKLLDTFSVSAPKTKEVVKVLSALNADRGVLIATNGLDRNLYLSAAQHREDDHQAGGGNQRLRRPLERHDGHHERALEGVLKVRSPVKAAKKATKKRPKQNG